jgi:hypothetical protein
LRVAAEAIVINITDSPYNAIGDGQTDDTSAIQAALNAVPTSPTSGAIVFAPPGTYLVSASLICQVSFTRFVGAGKNATIIMIANNSWKGFISSDGRGFVFDLASGVTDCAVENLTIDGNDRGQTSGSPMSGYAGGIRASAREFINRVSLYDIFGWSVWLGGQTSEHAELVDCDADSPSSGQRAGNDCIGGLGYRNKLVRFYWKPNLAKLDCLDLTNGGSGSECSVDLIDCVNESAVNILLEGCTQSTVIGCRFYGNTLKVVSDAKYTSHPSITNPRDIVVARCLFEQATLQVIFDGGDYQTGAPRATNVGGWISVLMNRFYLSPIAAIQWAGDDGSTSGGGSLIAGNRITDPNQSAQQGTQPIEGFFGSLGNAYAAGIAVMSSYGLAITDNSINDGTGFMPYSMQLTREDEAPPGQAQPILVKGNLCGNAPGVGNGNIATFYFGNSEYLSANNPLPILFRNTNQQSGYDAAASAAIQNGQPWPPGQGYQYDALVTVAGGSSSTTIEIDGRSTGLSTGSFYLSVGQQITVSWSAAAPPTISVFRLA